MSNDQKRWQVWISYDKPWGTGEEPFLADTYTDRDYAQSVADWHNEHDSNIGDNFYVKEVKLYQVMPRSENS